MATLYPSDLSDREWTILAPLIPPAKPGGRPRKWDMRCLLNGIFYVLRTGCAWRYVPHEYPPWSTVYHSLPHLAHRRSLGTHSHHAA